MVTTAKLDLNGKAEKGYFWLEPAIIFFLSFLLRMMLIVKTPYLYEWDAYVYLLGISSQHPLFTGLIKGMLAFGCSVLSIRVTVAGLASLACAAFYLFSKEVFGDRITAWVAAALMSIYPPFLVFSLVPYTESLFLVLFFMGLFCFTRENEADVNPNRPKHGMLTRYWRTGFFLGLACLTRHEALLILPLLYGTIVWQQPDRYLRKRSIASHIGLGLTLFWAPVLLSIYREWATPQFAAFQSEETQAILMRLLPKLNAMMIDGVPKFIADTSARGLWFPFWSCVMATFMALIGGMYAVYQDKKKHSFYLLFIVLATGIQLLPIVSNYKDELGRIIGLRRHGMVPAVCLIVYLCMSGKLIGQKLSRVVGDKAVHVTVMAFLVCVYTAAAYQTTAFLLNDYRKLFRTSTIRPHWVGGPADAGSGAVVAVSDRMIQMHLKETGLTIHALSTDRLPPLNWIRLLHERQSIKYVIAEHRFSPSAEQFIKTYRLHGFREIANVGGWFFVFVRDGR